MSRQLYSKPNSDNKELWRKAEKIRAAQLDQEPLREIYFRLHAKAIAEENAKRNSRKLQLRSRMAQG